MELGDERRSLRWWAVPLLLAALLVPFSPAALATAQAPGETGKYYVVGPPVNGQREYLYGIALRTLGNGNRFREIIELNTGRKQPDGATFTDGVELGPGWLLVLPRDADGPGVRTGALPVFGVPSTATGASSSPGTATGQPSPAATTPPAPPSPSPAAAGPPAGPATAHHSPADPAPADRPPSHAEPNRLGTVLIRVGAGALAVVLLVVALIVLRRGVYWFRPASLDDGPWPPVRHHTPTPAEIEALAAGTPPAYPVSEPLPSRRPAPPPPDLEPSMPQPSMPAPSMPAPSMAELSMAALSRPESRLDGMPAEPRPTARGLAEPPMPEQRLADLRTTELTQLRKAGRRMVARKFPRRAGPPAWPPYGAGRPTNEPLAVARNGVAVGTGPADIAVLPRPALPADGDVPYVRADVRTEVGPILVRLVGVATGPTTPAYAWLADSEPAPEAILPLVLGRKGPWRLHVDLGRTPDVLTLVGEAPDCRRLAAAFARQLYASGVGVAVVDDALGAETFDGCLRLTGFPERSDMSPDPCVVITAGLPAGAEADVRGLAAGSGGRCVPIVIGPVADGRWSAHLEIED